MDHYRSPLNNAVYKKNCKISVVKINKKYTDNASTIKYVLKVIRNRISKTQRRPIRPVRTTNRGRSMTW